MVRGLLALVSCQLAGDFVSRALVLPIPGPVLGMALLLGILLVLGARGRPGRTRRRARSEAAPTGGRRRLPGAEGTSVDRAADALIRHLQLLFVPAGAGIVVYLPELARSWRPVLGGLVLAWLATLLVSAAGAALVLRLQGRGAPGPPGPDAGGAA